MEDNKNLSAVAEIKALPGFELQVRELVDMQARESVKEEGILYFAPNEVCDEPGRYIFYEVYRSRADFESHIAAEHSKRFFQEIIGKVEGDKVKATFLNPVPF